MTTIDRILLHIVARFFVVAGLALWSEYASGVTIDLATVCPPGTTDCTAAVQRLIDTEIAASTPDKPGVIDFSAGTFPIKALFVRHNPAHPIKRIAGDSTTLKLIPKQPQYTRTLSVQWDGATDSPTCAIQGIIFDGSLTEQAWDGAYSLEHQAGLFLIGQNEYAKKPGRLDILVLGCQFNNWGSNGLFIHHQVKGVLANCSARDCVTGGLHINGSEVDLFISHFDSTSPTVKSVSQTSLQCEPYGALRQHLTFADCHATAIDLSIPSANSVVTLIRCETGQSCNVLNFGKFRTYGCTLNGGIFFTHVGDAALTETTLIATDGVAGRDTYMPKCCCWVQWYQTGKNTGQVLRLDRSILKAADGVTGAIGFRVNTAKRADGNQVQVTDCKGDASLAMFGYMEKMGSTWLLRSNAVDCATFMRLIAAPDYPYDVTLVGNVLGSNVKTYINTTYDLPQNKMRHVDSVVPASQNVFVSSRPIGTVGLNQYSGSRLIVSDVAGAPVRAAGLPGDVYQDAAGAKWRVKTPGYVSAAWEAVP